MPPPLPPNPQVTADLVITGTRIWTGLEPAGSRPRPGAVAIGGGRILAIGTDEQITELARSGRARGARRLHLPGRLVVPGFQDAHVHPMFAGRFLTNLALHPLGDAPAYLTAIRAHATAHPEQDWIYGAGWEAQNFTGGGPNRFQLDNAVADRPAFLFNASLHEAWVNSLALRLAGLGRHTPDPGDGRYVRDSITGELTGHLIEGAAYRFEAEQLPSPDAAQLEQAILAGQRHLHRLGVTSWQDAWVTPPALAGYAALADAGALTGRVRAALWWDRDRGLEQIAGFEQQRADGARPGLSPWTVKIMVDGVMENFSAGLLAPYHHQHVDPRAAVQQTGPFGDRDSGLIYVDPDLLAAAVTDLDLLGFQVHLHTLGDRAVRLGLDAVQAALDANGDRGNRHHLAHLQLIDPDDVPRFASLRATANLQTYWAQSEPAMDELTIPFLGERRAGLQYPFASLAAAGARLAMGSDWPVTTADPLAQIEVAVRRIGPTRRGSASFLPAERLTLEAAMRAFTSGSAYVNHDPDGGVLGPGLRADLAVLSRDPFAELSPDDPFATAIADARVEYTIASGRIVHQPGG